MPRTSRYLGPFGVASVLLRRSHHRFFPVEPMLSRPKIASTSLAVLALGLVTLLAHGSALDAFWRHDDGWHLLFAASFSPEQYFFDPLITRGISGANLTPWNPFRYDIGLALFGLRPGGFYALHLVSLWLISVASFLLLRLWLDRPFAFFGALTFLLGAPSFLAAQQLMVGHYLDGLAFAILAVYAFVVGVRGKRRWLAVAAGTGFYVLATSCKEVFVPLPGILPFLREGSLRTRLACGGPYFAWTLGYFVWRSEVLGSLVGGYRQDPLELDFVNVLTQFASIPEHLFGAAPVAAVLLILLVLAVMVWRRGQLNLVLPAASLVLVLGPLVPLSVYPGIEGSQRYLFLLWWCLSVFVPCLAYRAGAGSPAYLFLAAPILLFGAYHGWRERSGVQADLHRFEAAYAFALEGEPDRILVEDFIDDPWYMDLVLNGAVIAKAITTGRPVHRIGVLARGAGPLDQVPRRYRVWEYAQSCECLREIHTEDRGIRSDVGPERDLMVARFPPPYPPYPALEPGMAGVIDHQERRGDRLTLQGWARMEDREPGQQLLVLAPLAAREHRIEPLPRPDVVAEVGNPSLGWSGFRITLGFADGDAAARAAAHLCVIARSALSPPRLLADAAHPACRGLLLRDEALSR